MTTLLRLTTLLLLLLIRAHATPPIVIGVDGGTESIRACCFNALDGTVIGDSCAVPYKTTHPHPGWAEQNPNDWWDCLGEAVRGAVASLSEDDQEDIKAICIDTTCCSVVALDAEYEPLRPSLLWMDQRSAPQCAEILEKAKGDPALLVNANGEGPLSAEWMTPKALWLKQEEPHVYKASAHICEYQDYMNYKLTGILCASSCNAATRWHWNGKTAIDNDAGRPQSLYDKLGLSELSSKLPQSCLAMGTPIGTLTKEAAHHLNLSEKVPVIQGGPDAFVGMIGLGVISAKQLCLITGSSHLHCVVSADTSTAQGIWGPYPGAPLPLINFAEGGQSSTGSIVRWMKNVIFGSDELSYKDLDDAAAAVPPGSDGLVVLETFQGSRTPVTDPLARGAMIGLTLSHTRAHMWRACLEAVCFGTRACIQGLEDAGHGCSEIILAGGVTRSPLWLQLHADVTGKPVVVCENSNAPLLGCAVLATVGAGIHASTEEAVRAMVRTKQRIEPNPTVSAVYAELYNKVYSKVSPAVRPIVHTMANLRGGGGGGGGGDALHQSKSRVSVSPSLLACDWTRMAEEVQRCVDAGTTHLHVDIFDGVSIDSPHAFTFGPKMVQLIRASFGNAVVMDLHMCVHRPERFVQAMAEAGATRFVFQYEVMSSHDEAVALAQSIVDAGMSCGISLNPATPTEVVYPLLLTGLVDLVDVLAVNPGFGGQVFQQDSALNKIRQLSDWRKHNNKSFCILVDGGINADTAPLAIEAGADILVAGTFLFQHPQGLSQGAQELMRHLSEASDAPRRIPFTTVGGYSAASSKIR